MHVTSVVSTSSSLPIRGAGWRYLPAHFVVFMLALLLVSTTPMGTGAGVHQFDLVHPLFAHVHLVNGRVLTHEQIDRADATARATGARVYGWTGFRRGRGRRAGRQRLGVEPDAAASVRELTAGDFRPVVQLQRAAACWPQSKRHPIHHPRPLRRYLRQPSRQTGAADSVRQKDLYDSERCMTA